VFHTFVTEPNGREHRSFGFEVFRNGALHAKRHNAFESRGHADAAAKTAVAVAQENDNRRWWG
jgi:hypothetical protein